MEIQEVSGCTDMAEIFTAIKTKSPGGRVLSGVTLCNYFLLGFLTLNANAI